MPCGFCEDSRKLGLEEMSPEVPSIESDTAEAGPPAAPGPG